MTSLIFNTKHANAKAYMRLVQAQRVVVSASSRSVARVFSLIAALALTSSIVAAQQQESGEFVFPRSP